MLYDGEGHLTRHTDANGSYVVKDRLYDGYGRLTRENDAMGNYARYWYDDADRVTRVSRYDSGNTHLARTNRIYDALGRLTQENRAVGGGNDNAKVSMFYDANDRLTRRVTFFDTTAGSYAVESYTYDAAGRLITQTQSDGPTVAMLYDASGGVTKQIVDPAGLAITTTMAYDELGRVTRATQPDGTYSVTLYDGLGRVTKTSQHASGGTAFAVSQMLYDDGLNVVTKTYRYADPATQGNFNATTDPATAYLYDTSGTGRLTATVDANGNTSSFTYDDLGRQIETTDALGNKMQMVYDNADRVLTRIRIDENAPGSDVEFKVAMQYDALNRVTKTIDQGPDGDIASGGDNLASSVWYDALGRVTQSEDPSGQIVAMHYDMVGNVTRKIEDSGGIGRYTDSMHDRAGRLTRITGYTSGTSGGQHTDYAYDKAGKLTRTTYPDDNSGGGDRGYVVHTYDTPGRLTRINHQDNTNTDVAWDVTNRPTAITKGTEVDTFGYTDWGAIATAERGTSANPDAISKVERAYDGLNRMTRESQSIREGTARHVDYAYDKSANVLTLTYPGGTEIVTSYDALHRGDVVKKDGSQIADYGYTGPRHTSLVLETGANDVTLSLAYDGAQGGRLTRMTYAQTGGSGLPDYSYAFDASSNITRKTFNHRSGTPSEDYLHDTLDRLTKTTFGQRTSTPYEGFVYDDLGNHLTQDQNGTAVAGLFNSVNEQTKRDGNDVTWDLRGNLTGDDTGKEYFYDRQNLLTRVEDGSSNRIASYAYDALGRRIEKDVEDAPGIGGQVVTRFYYSGQQMIEETDDGGTPSVEREYVWGTTYIDELLLYNDGTDDYFAARHHNFNVMALLDDADGSVVERYDYDPYGKRYVLDADYSDDADGLSDVGLNIGHQGLLHDMETGLIYNRARMLNPAIGRFMQRDPLEYVDGMLVYAYYAGLHGSRDPFGLQVDSVSSTLAVTMAAVSVAMLALQDALISGTPDEVRRAANELEDKVDELNDLVSDVIGGMLKDTAKKEVLSTAATAATAAASATALANTADRLHAEAKKFADQQFPNRGCDWAKCVLNNLQKRLEGHQKQAQEHMRRHDDPSGTGPDGKPNMPDGDPTNLQDIQTFQRVMLNHAARHYRLADAARIAINAAQKAVDVLCRRT